MMTLIRHDIGIARKIGRYSDATDSAPAAFRGLLKGANFGKQLVRVGPDKV
jgi:NADPH-dependent curcumin reductase CurA